MKRSCLLVFIFAAVSASLSRLDSQSKGAPAYLGFDRNAYPGDDNLAALHQTFSFAGFWLNNPPDEHSNPWIGKRQVLQSAGFGFLVLFNGRLDAELKSVGNAARLAKIDAQSAIDAAHREGFPAQTIIFLDLEEGGRMLPEQKAYIYAWVDGIAASDFRAGIYCSGIPATDDENVITANDIRQHAGGRQLVFFVTNDMCPPSPGCAAFPPSPGASGIPYAEVWQFAQSPKRSDFAKACPANYNPDGNCYPPVIETTKKLHIDLDTATSADPSHGR